MSFCDCLFWSGWRSSKVLLFWVLLFQSTTQLSFPFSLFFFTWWNKSHIWICWTEIINKPVFAGLTLVVNVMSLSTFHLHKATKLVTLKNNYRLSNDLIHMDPIPHLAVFTAVEQAHRIVKRQQPFVQMTRGEKWGAAKNTHTVPWWLERECTCLAVWCLFL